MKLDYNVVAQQYAQHRQVHPEVLRHLVQTAELGTASRVLDVGCGTGNYAIALEEVTGCSSWGVDPSEQMLAVAKARSPNARFGVGSAAQLAYPAHFFDLVFSVDVIHHIGDRSAYFREAHRVLKTSGKMCTVTDSEEIIRRRQPLSVYFPETIAYELQRYPRISDIRTLMAQLGFGDLEETVAEYSYSLTDIQSYRDKAFSCLHLISSEAFDQGLLRMEQDLRTGPLSGTARYVLVWGTKWEGRAS